MRLPIFLKYRVVMYFIFALLLADCFTGFFEAKTAVAVLEEGIQHEQRRILRERETGIGEKDDTKAVSSGASSGATSESSEGVQATTSTGVEDPALRPELAKWEAIQDDIVPIGYLEMFIFLVLIVTLIVYNHPVTRVLKQGNEQVAADILRKAKIRVLNVTRFTLLLCWIYTLVKFVFALYVQWLYAGSLSLMNVLFLTMIHVFYGVIASTVVLALCDSHIFKFIPRIYPHEEIFWEKREGRNLTIDTRIRLMVLTTSIIPLALLLYIHLISQGPAISSMAEHLMAKDEIAILDHLAPVIWLLFALMVTFFSIVISLVVSSGIRRSIVYPLSNMVGKMHKASEGDLSVKATVFTNDEIGQLRASYNTMLDGLKQRDYIKDTFGKFMSLEIAREILEHGKIDLGGEEVEATILFSDIRNFTAMSEKMSAREVVDFLNDFFSHIVEPILTNHGVVNKYIGDCVMALFGVPNKIDDHPDRAVLSALAMRKALTTYNRQRRDRGEDPISIGIGIHTGTLISGNIGSKDRLEYTVIGDTVNVASRIESETKNLGCDILISKETHSRLSEEVKNKIRWETCSDVKVKGKDVALTLYKALPLHL